MPRLVFANVRCSLFYFSLHTVSSFIKKKPDLMWKSTTDCMVFMSEKDLKCATPFWIWQFVICRIVIIKLLLYCQTDNYQYPAKPVKCKVQQIVMFELSVDWHRRWIRMSVNTFVFGIDSCQKFFGFCMKALSISTKKLKKKKLFLKSASIGKRSKNKFLSKDYRKSLQLHQKFG